jgi:hypothetical protein
VAWGAIPGSHADPKTLRVVRAIKSNRACEIAAIRARGAPRASTWWVRSGGVGIAHRSSYSWNGNVTDPSLTGVWRSDPPASRRVRTHNDCSSSRGEGQLDVTIAAAHWWANVPLATVTREYVWEQGLADKHFSVASRASRDIPLSGYSAGDKTVACYTRRLIRQPPRPLFPGRSVTPGPFGGSLHTTS